MRVLLDECVPRGLRRHLAGHAVRTVTECGWSGIKNGALLRLASQSFDVVLTVDQAMGSGRQIHLGSMSLLRVRSASNAIDQLLPLVPAILKALERIRPGEAVNVPDRRLNPPR